MPHTWVHHVTYINESPHKHVTYMNASRYIHKPATPHASRIHECVTSTNINESPHTHVTCMNASCHIHNWVAPHICQRTVTPIDVSCHTYEWVTSHIWMSHITHMNESRHPRPPRKSPNIYWFLLHERAPHKSCSLTRELSQWSIRGRSLGHRERVLT